MLTLTMTGLLSGFPQLTLTTTKVHSHWESILLRLLDIKPADSSSKVDKYTSEFMEVTKMPSPRFPNGYNSLETKTESLMEKLEYLENITDSPSRNGLTTDQMPSSSFLLMWLLLIQTETLLRIMLNLTIDKLQDGASLSKRENRLACSLHPSARPMEW